MVKRVNVVALTAAIMTGVKPITVYSMITTSIAKITPAKGVLNAAEIAAATPLPTKMRIPLLGICKRCPNMLPAAAPK